MTAFGRYILALIFGWCSRTNLPVLASKRINPGSCDQRIPISWTLSVSGDQRRALRRCSFVGPGLRYLGSKVIFVPFSFIL